MGRQHKCAFREQVAEAEQAAQELFDLTVALRHRTGELEEFFVDWLRKRPLAHLDSCQCHICLAAIRLVGTRTGNRI